MKLLAVQDRILANIRAGRWAGADVPTRELAENIAALVKRKIIRPTRADVGPAYTVTKLGDKIAPPRLTVDEVRQAVADAKAFLSARGPR